jgi:hypothetical protein
LSQIAPHVPRPITELVERMMTVDRSARPPDLREMLELLRPYTDAAVLSFGSASRPIVVSERTDPFSKTTYGGSRKRRWLVLALVAALCAVGLGIVWRFGRPASPSTPSVSVPTPPTATPPTATPPTVTPPTTAPPTTTTPTATPSAAIPPTPPHKRSGAASKRKPSKLPGGVVDQVPF